MKASDIKPNPNNPLSEECSHCLRHFISGYKTFVKQHNLCRACYKRKLRNGTPNRKQYNDGFYKEHERESNSYESMIQRCTNPKHDSFGSYGARGIKITGRWMGVDGFKNFVADMGLRPAGTSLERIDNNGNYEPKNCKWATIKEQLRNTRRNHNLTIHGKTMCLTDWATQSGIHWRTILGRVNAGWDLQKAVTFPVARSRKCQTQ